MNRPVFLKQFVFISLSNRFVSVAAIATIIYKFKIASQSVSGISKEVYFFSVNFLSSDPKKNISDVYRYLDAHSDDFVRSAQTFVAKNVLRDLFG